MNIKYYFPFVLVVLFAACTPKVTEPIKEAPTTTVEATEEKVEESLSACKNWNGIASQDNIMAAHVLYKDGLKEIRAEQRKGAAGDQKKIDSLYQIVYGYWTYAYEEAPAADGKRADHFQDGIKIYEYFASQTSDKSKKQAYVDTIMTLYDARVECYGEEGYVMGSKAFDYYYKYPGMATDMEKYEMFKKSIDLDGEKAQYFILNPFTALLINLVIEEKVPIEEARVYQNKIRGALANGLANCKSTRECEPWKVVESYVPESLERLEGVKGFYDCEYYKSKYASLVDESPDDCEAITSVLSKLKWGGCDATDTKVAEVNQLWKTKCYVPSSPTVTCSGILRDGDYKGAIECYESKAEEISDAGKKAEYYLVIAKIYYGELKRFGDSRKYARKALAANPNMGAAYILIGKLYASSGPLCGPGRGWDSQVVTWPAIDKWNKAKSVDPSVASEANRLIGTYSKYMPDVADIFQRGLKVGDSFTVPCWIQERTKIRAAK